MKSLPLQVFSTCPPWDGTGGEAYVRRVIEAARWSDAWGYTGMLVYTDNSLLDPWLVSHLILQATEHLGPLVAVQPVYMHPYSVAKFVTSIAALHRRRVHLNMVAGGFKNDLDALDDKTPHDRRYDRLVEYTQIVTRLLATGEPVTFEGEFYRVQRVRLTPPLPSDLLPGVYVSGSSDAGLAAARMLGATAIKYPKPASEENAVAASEIGLGIRVGIIARDDPDEAWATARARFPENRRGQLTHQLAVRTSDSVWHRELSEREAAPDASPYWLVPFRNYKTFCPYLVGSYERVAEELARYLNLGYRALLLDVPATETECAHIDRTLARAAEVSGCPSYSSIG